MTNKKAINRLSWKLKKIKYREEKRRKLLVNTITVVSIILLYLIASTMTYNDFILHGIKP